MYPSLCRYKGRLWLPGLAKALAVNLLFLLAVQDGVAAAPVRGAYAGLRTEISVDFDINRWNIDCGLASNSEALAEIKRQLVEIAGDTSLVVESVTVRGAASPDGGTRLNNELSRRRMESLMEYVNRETGLPDSLLASGVAVIPWDTFRALVSRGGYPWQEAVLEVIGEGDDDSPADVNRRLRALKRMESGRVWHILAKEVFPGMRKAYVIIIKVAPAESPAGSGGCHGGDEEPPVVEAEPETASVAAIDVEPSGDAPSLPACGSGSWRVKTSLPAWAAAVANIAGEWDFACRWSLGLDVAYSAWDYGKATRKFRTFQLRPEARYWFADGHKGWFVEAHLAMISYNVALPGWEWRIQDTDGTNPALGGGFGVGYRLPLSRDNRWHAECAVGAGVYSLRYDRFDNRRDGRLHDSVSRIWGGIDHVSLSVVYTFNLDPR